MTVPKDDILGTWTVSWSLVGVGSLFVVTLSVILVPLFDLGLLDILNLLEVFGLLAALVVGLRALLPLVTAAIDVSGYNGVWSKVSVLCVTLKYLNKAG